MIFRLGRKEGTPPARGERGLHPAFEAPLQETPLPLLSLFLSLFTDVVPMEPRGEEVSKLRKKSRSLTGVPAQCGRPLECLLTASMSGSRMEERPRLALERDV